MNVGFRKWVVSFCWVFILGVSHSVFAAVWYVDINNNSGTEDGTSWGTAFVVIQDAIDAANTGGGGEIWVADGDYAEAIIMKSNVAVYGGFLGTETLLADRDFANNISKIDGTGLSTSVVTIESVSNTRVDGFTITGGTGTENVYNRAYGGGVRIDSVDNTNLVFNCIIRNNTSNYYGAGMSIVTASPRVEHCLFTENILSVLDDGNTGGGGIFIHGSADVESQPLINDCQFIDNEGYSGGGIWMWYFTAPMITGCTFSGNTATNAGGAIKFQADCNPIIADTVIDDNTAATGGGIYLAYKCIGYFDQLRVSNNRADSGGGINVAAASIIMSNSHVLGNTASNQGAGINVSSNPTGREASTFTDCLIVGNVTGSYQGGGVQLVNSDSLFENCIISGNFATSVGGGLHLHNSSPTLTNCVISGNYGYNAGAVSMKVNSSPSFMNSTIADNTAVIGGGGIQLISSSNPTFTNSIFYNNDNQAIYEYPADSDVTLINCLFESNPQGDYRDYELASVVSGAKNLNDLADVSNVGNFDGLSLFLPGLSGTWTGVGAYDSVSNTTILTDNSLSLTVDALAGKIINTSSLQRIQAYIVSNTADTITVVGDVTSYTAVADAYFIVDYHIDSNSDVIDMGDAVDAPLFDFDNEERPFNSYVDVGADEWVDTDGDGDSDYVDLDDDNDGISDADELNLYNTDPLDSDSDLDGISDYMEIMEYLTNPNEGDSDFDGASDWAEIFIFGTDPNASTDLIFVDFGWVGNETGKIDFPMSTFESALGMVDLAGVIMLNGGSLDTQSAWNGTLSNSMYLDAYDGAVRIGE